MVPLRPDDFDEEKCTQMSRAEQSALVIGLLKEGLPTDEPPKPDNVVTLQLNDERYNAQYMKTDSYNYYLSLFSYIIIGFALLANIYVLIFVPIKTALSLTVMMIFTLLFNYYNEYLFNRIVSVYNYFMTSYIIIPENPYL